MTIDPPDMDAFYNTSGKYYSILTEAHWRANAFKLTLKQKSTHFVFILGPLSQTFHLFYVTDYGYLYGTGDVSNIDPTVTEISAACRIYANGIYDIPLYQFLRTTFDI